MAALPSIGAMMDRGEGMHMEPSRKRLRVSHACDVCRARKIRCDGNTPCAACAAADCDCTYGSEANSRGKSDLILEGVLRVERLLQEMNLGFASSPLSQHPTAQQLPFAQNHRTGSIGGSSFSGSPLAEVHLSPFSHQAGPAPPPPPQPPSGPPVPGPISPHHSNSQQYTHPHPHSHQQQQRHQQQQQQATPTTCSAAEPHSLNSLENAVLDSMHTSTTESILQWPHFDVFPGLRDEYVSIFALERRRRSLRPAPRTSPPRVPASEVMHILDAFQDALNFWYPTASVAQMDRCRAVLLQRAESRESEDEDDNVEEDDEDDEDDDDDANGDEDSHGTSAIDRCLAYLLMALGCASQVVAGLANGQPLSEDDMRFRRARRSLGDAFFEQVLRNLHVVHMAVGSGATHCLFLIGLYFAFLRRPLQAWEYINAASARCLLLISYDSESQEDSEDQERIRRIFWSCYILESDYLAELSGLPQSGIARIESSVALPGKTAYKTHRAPLAEEQSSLYFLACISMRRLLNRVHQLLYARDTGAALDPARFPYVVAELDHQLEEWRDVLPAAFAFTLDTRPCATEHGGFLRQRYLTCRSVIYRPYLMWMLSGAGPDLETATGGAPPPPQLPNKGGSSSNSSSGAAGSATGGLGGGLGGGIVGVTDEPLDAASRSRACLDACLLHMLNLRGFGHTVLVDTWICALSMAGAMCVLLAACRTPVLREMLATTDVLACGPHLGRLFEAWTTVAGGPASPSIEQSMRIIAEADRFISEFCAAAVDADVTWGLEAMVHGGTPGSLRPTNWGRHGTGTEKHTP